MEFTLLGPNGNFPYLVSVFNAQSVITPEDYVTGSTLDGLKNGTGAFKLDTYDLATGAKFVRNDTWWGGKTPLDGIEFIFFTDTGPMVTAYQGGQVDAIVQFDVNSGAALFDDPNFTALKAKTTNHRQIWMRCDTGQFKDKRVRQALALTLDQTRDDHPSSSRARDRSPTITSSSACTRTSIRQSRNGRGTWPRRSNCSRTPASPASRPICTPSSSRRSGTSRCSSRATRRKPAST